MHLEAFVPDARSPWDFAAAAHLWRRAGFCAAPERVEQTLELSPAEAARALVRGPAQDAALNDLESIYPSVLGLGGADPIRSWLVARMLRCGHQLREKLALFWHGHFATSLAKVRDEGFMARQYRLFLDGALGRFGDLLSKVARDPAMIRWLDNETNRKGHPNENYARELFELFTLGPGHYSENDIQEAARAFTGWSILRDAFHFAAPLHDDGEKSVLGRRGAFGGDDILRIALEQEACGTFLAGKLLRFFVAPEPPPDAVAEFGALLRGNGYDLSASLEVLFASRLFYDPAHRRALIKSPLEFLVGGARCLGIEPDASALVPLLREMGQDLLAPPNVKGWPGHRDWINTASWMTRVNAARELTKGAAGLSAERSARSLLGAVPGDAAARALSTADASPAERAHALLCLPESHLS
ncbi:MAG: DUF1800 domain-containing protein [Planctomycetaceae bacterium]